MTLLPTGAANEPVILSLGLAGDGDILARLCLEITALVPVDSYILDELEGPPPNNRE